MPCLCTDYTVCGPCQHEWDALRAAEEWRDPCCRECGDRELEEVEGGGSYVRLEKGKVAS